MESVFSYRAAFALLVSLCLSVPAHSYPTSNSFIPTADVLKPGEFRLEYENDGGSATWGRNSTDYFLTQWSLSSRLEAGVDIYDLSGENDYALNAKYLLQPETVKNPAVAVGIIDVGAGGAPSYYVVSTRTFGKLRGHGGGWRIDSANHTLAGLDYQITGKDYLLADWVSGDDNYATVGVYRELGGGHGLTVGYGKANNGDNTDLFYVNYLFTARYRR